MAKANSTELAVRLLDALGLNAHQAVIRHDEVDDKDPETGKPFKRRVRADVSRTQAVAELLEEMGLAEPAEGSHKKGGVK